jgi:hypothetical protein
MPLSVALAKADRTVYNFGLAITTDVVSIRKPGFQSIHEVSMTGGKTWQRDQSLHIFRSYRLTPSIEQYPYVHTLLRKVALDVIPLHNQVGLLMFRRTGFYKRLGVLRLRGEQGWVDIEQEEKEGVATILKGETHGRSQLQSRARYNGHMELQDYFLTRRWTIYIV